MKGGGTHLKASDRRAQLRAELRTGPKSVAQLKVAMGCSDTLVRGYAASMPDIGSRRSPEQPGQPLEYFLMGAEP